MNKESKQNDKKTERKQIREALIHSGLVVSKRNINQMSVAILRNKERNFNLSTLDLAELIRESRNQF